MGHQLPSSEILFSHTTGTDGKGNDSAEQPKKKPKSAESLHVIGGYGTFSRAFGNSLPEGSLRVIYEEINFLYKKTLRQKKNLLKKKKHNVIMSKESSDLSFVAERADTCEKLGVWPWHTPEFSAKTWCSWPQKLAQENERLLWYVPSNLLQWKNNQAGSKRLFRYMSYQYNARLRFLKLLPTCASKSSQSSIKAQFMYTCNKSICALLCQT